MYEPRTTPPLPPPRIAFVRRLATHAAAAAGLLAASLGAGMAGYVHFERLPWIDAFLDAAMLLGDMGPVNTPRTEGGLLFAGLHALYAGLVFIVTAARVPTPLLHRVLHRFHWDGRG